MDRIQNLLDRGLANNKCFSKFCKEENCGINFDSDDFFVNYTKVFEMLGKDMPIKPDSINYKKGEK